MRVALLTTFLHPCIGLYGQLDLPFPDSAAIWVQVYETMIVPPPFPDFEVTATANFCMDGSDTTISANIYTVIERCEGVYVGALREDSGDVYFVPADSVQEFLLYDFSVDVGDTLFAVYSDESIWGGVPGPVVRDLIVMQIDPDVDGLAYIYLDELVPGFGTTWVEGIGCMDGLFTYSTSNVSNYWFHIQCMSHLDTIRFPYSLPGTCIPYYVGMPEVDPAQIAMGPNPTNNTVVIELPDEHLILEIFLLDLQGRLIVHDARTAQSRSDFDLSGAPAGTYLLSVRSTLGTAVHRVVKD